MKTELISKYYDDSLASYFGIKKTRELIAKKYNWSILRADIGSYTKGSDMCLASKSVKHKPYSDLHSLLVLTHE